MIGVVGVGIPWCIDRSPAIGNFSLDSPVHIGGRYESAEYQGRDGLSQDARASMPTPRSYDSACRAWSGWLTGSRRGRTRTLPTAGRGEPVGAWSHRTAGRCVDRGPMQRAAAGASSDRGIHHGHRANRRYSHRYCTQTCAATFRGIGRCRNCAASANGGDARAVRRNYRRQWPSVLCAVRGRHLWGHADGTRQGNSRSDRRHALTACDGSAYGPLVYRSSHRAPSRFGAVPHYGMRASRTVVRDAAMGVGMTRDSVGRYSCMNYTATRGQCAMYARLAADRLKQGVLDFGGML